MQTISFSQTRGLGHVDLESHFSLRSLLAVIVLHVVAVFILLSMNVMPIPSQLETLMVRVIQPESPEQEEARRDEIVPPIPKPAVRLPVPKVVPLPQPQTSVVATVEPSTADEKLLSGHPDEVPVVKDVPPPEVTEAAITEPRFDAGYLDNPAPLYPVISRRMMEEGTVLLRVFVEPNGRPSQIQVSTGSGSHRLDQTAQEAVWRWKFAPARRGSWFPLFLV